MPATEADVPTARAARYLAQLCDHAGRLSAAGDAAAPRRAQHADNEGVIDLGWARCTLTATDAALILRAESDSPQGLVQLQERLTRTLERVGRRDRLAVTWSPVDDGTTPAAALVHELMSTGGRTNPYPLYARAHRLGPVARVADGYVLVTGYDAVNEILRNPGFGLAAPPQTPSNTGEDGASGTFSTSGAFGASGALRSMTRSILRADPPDHGRMRSLISQVFTPRRVATLEPAIEAAVDRLLGRLAAVAGDSAAIDFMDAFAFPLPVTVICELLGVPEAERERFRPLAADLTEALELSEDLSTAADAAARELAACFGTLIADRRARPRDDLIGALVAARDAGDDRLSEEELLANLILLLVAGFETTTSLLGNGLAVLREDRRLTEQLRGGEIPVAAFVEEVLRFDSPVQVTTRIARADGLTIAGEPVPRGTQAILLIGAANRDPRRYPDPDRFDATRTDTRPLSFGAGAHICLGNGLARLEATVAFPRILALFTDIGADPDREPTRRDRLVLRGHQTLPVRLARGHDRTKHVPVERQGRAQV
jgi:cytochrome P450